MRSFVAIEGVVIKANGPDHMTFVMLDDGDFSNPPSVYETPNTSMLKTGMLEVVKNADFVFYKKTVLKNRWQ